MTLLWNVWASSPYRSCRLNTVYRVLGLVYLIVCGMAAVELATAQDERAIRRIVVAPISHASGSDSASRHTKTRRRVRIILGSLASDPRTAATKKPRF